MQGLTFHHVGMVVPSLAEAGEYFCGALGYQAQGAAELDPVQKVWVQFLRLGAFVLELIEPAAPDSPVHQFLRKGGGMQHICYACEDLEAQVQRLRALGAGLACPPTPAVAMNGKRIAFLVNRQRQLIELVEA